MFAHSRDCVHTLLCVPQFIHALTAFWFAVFASQSSFMSFFFRRFWSAVCSWGFYLNFFSKAAINLQFLFEHNSHRFRTSQEKKSVCFCPSFCFFFIRLFAISTFVVFVLLPLFVYLFSKVFFMWNNFPIGKWIFLRSCVSVLCSSLLVLRIGKISQNDRRPTDVEHRKLKMHFSL